MTIKNNYILIGPPGSGKGTQAELLLKKYRYLHYVYPGDMYRDFVKLKTKTAKVAKKILDQGGLQPMELNTALWVHEIAYNVKASEKFLLDGCPRRLVEGVTIRNFLNFIDELKSTRILFIDVSKKEAFDRLLHRRVCKKCENIIPWVGKYKDLKRCDKCGGELTERADDQGLVKLKRRFSLYEKDTIPAINYLKKYCKLIKINGEQSIENVFKEIVKKIEQNG